MSDEERRAAALSDPDAQPLTPEDFSRMKRTPQVSIIRRALGLSQEEFAARFQIPLGTLRDWEQGRKDPDAAARAYLKVIGRNPGAGNRSAANVAMSETDLRSGSTFESWLDEQGLERGNRRRGQKEVRRPRATARRSSRSARRPRRFAARRRGEKTPFPRPSALRLSKVGP